MKRTPLKRVSKKRAALNRLRSTFVHEQLQKYPDCETYHFFTQQNWLRHPLSKLCSGVSTELHEPLTRARAPGAETILDVGNSVAICRWCHRWVHDNPAAATEVGLLKSSGAKP